MDLSASDGNLELLEFNQYELNYDVKVNSDVSSIEVTATADDENATITIDGKEGTNKLIDLFIGDTVIKVEVTAEDGETKKTYTITVEREVPPLSEDANLIDLTVSEGELTPAFAADDDEYIVEVEDDITSIEVSAIAADDENATIKIDQI
ncbi:cadherin-like beta sandwich domain-containing protein [Chengkuizengella sediminis]|uniref:cadherin-like beta sandwich domain-containing protein n=1 Tax=Chengkuizengella sediminis TaxID=1885917 RepID=UPI0013898407|nr:cadherin-like beta sandwich domain-containing protein [Chengkuizengella sediminis]